MTTLLFLWTWLLSARAAWATVSFDVCVDVDVNVVDHAGDYWITNANDRDGRGFRVAVVQTSPPSTTWTFADDEGCVRDFPLATASQTVAVHVKSEARVSGVDLHSWSGPSDGSRPREEVVFSLYPAVHGLSVNLTVQPTGQSDRSVWRNLLVATMVFKSHDWNVDDPPSRACCVPGTEQANGTCGTPADEYLPIATPVQLQAARFDSKGNAQSRLVLADGTDAPTWRGDGTSLPGVYSHWTAEKRVIAHELGHVIVSHRAGGQEAVNQNAPMNGCAGSFAGDGTPVAQAGYGYLTKEYVSLAWKEGWADFVAVATFNDGGEVDCDVQNPGFDQDWDLDGVIDLGPGFRSAHPGDYRSNRGVDVPIDALAGTIDCEGAPDVEGLQPVPYTWSPSWTVNAQNWLSDLEVAPDPGGCVATTYPAEENRATRYDIVRMLWDLRTDQGLSPAQLSNLATSTCFRTWRAADGSSSTDARLPWRRLEASAAALGLTTPFQAEDDHVWH